MPDMKYSDDQIAKKLSGVSGYVPANRAAVKEMHRQVGDLEVDERGIAVEGLLVRHLVLPGIWLAPSKRHPSSPSRSPRIAT